MTRARYRYLPHRHSRGARVFAIVLALALLPMVLALYILHGVTWGIATPFAFLYDTFMALLERCIAIGQMRASDHTETRE